MNLRRTPGSGEKGAAAGYLTRTTVPAPDGAGDKAFEGRTAMAILWFRAKRYGSTMSGLSHFPAAGPDTCGLSEKLKLVASFRASFNRHLLVRCSSVVRAVISFATVFTGERRIPVAAPAWPKIKRKRAVNCVARITSTDGYLGDKVGFRIIAEIRHPHHAMQRYGRQRPTRSVIITK